MSRPYSRLLTIATRATLVIASTLACGDAVPHAHAQTSRTIKIVVPFPPGGGADTLARLVAEHMGRANGLTIVTENRPGGGHCHRNGSRVAGGTGRTHDPLRGEFVRHQSESEGAQL